MSTPSDLRPTRPPHAFSVAPMMDRTDRHFRWLARQLTRRALLYTEMVVADTILHHVNDGRLEHYVGFDPIEHPVAIQLGGDDPRKLAEASRIVAERGYDEINLNVGCPSERVKDGCFGAVLMREPERVAGIVAAMRDAAPGVPVTVKHRIGVDELDRYEDMASFVEVVAGAGVTTFAVHARKAWLSGLSPAENRTIPPLRYDDVYRLKREHPALTIVINGGVTGIDAAAAHLEHLDGVMVGRAAYDDPLWLGEVDERVFDVAPPATATDVEALVEASIAYASRTVAGRTTLRAIYRHLLALFHGRPGARRWRRLLSDALGRPGVGPAALRDVLRHVRREVDEFEALRRAG